MTALDRDVARRLLVRHYAAHPGEGTLRVVDTGSMAPLIGGGTCSAHVEWGVPAGSIPLGRLVVAALPTGVVVLHRLVATRPGATGELELLLAADADDGDASGLPARYVPLPTGYPSPWLPEGSVLGMVTAVTSATGSRLYDVRSWCSWATDSLALWFARRLGVASSADGRRERLLRRARYACLRATRLIFAATWSVSSLRRSRP